MKKQVVIIGAGPAGLTTAYYLLKNSNKYDVIVLEKDNIVGGISKTVEFAGYKIDTGIHRFFTKNDEVEKLWEELLPIQGKPSYDDKLLDRKKPYVLGGPNPEKDDNTMLIKDRITRIYYGRKFYDYPVSLNMTTIKNMGFFTLVKAGFSYLKSCVHKLPETNLENFYINRFGKVLYSMFFESYTEKVWGLSPKEISADWGAQRVKGLSITAVLLDIIKKVLGLKKNSNSETSLIEQFIYPKLGSGHFYEAMANKIKQMGGQIILNADVSGIKVNSKNKISNVIYTQGNNEINIKTDICISSMPIKELFEITKGIEIPKSIYNIAKNLPYREFMSVGLVVDKLKLENTTNIKTLNDVVPDSWIYIQEPDVKMGRLQIFNNWSPYMFKKKEEIKNKVMFSLEYFCSENDEYWNMTDEEFIDFAISEAIKLNLIDSKESVEASIRIKVPKAYPAYFGTYSKIDKVVNYLNKFDNLYCIGRNGQHRYNNMDHSMLTGIETAKTIIENKDNKQDIWNVNVEKEYHEVKKKENNCSNNDLFINIKNKFNKFLDKNKIHIIVMFIYAFITLISLFHHEPWRDEAQAWLIGRDLSFFGIFKQMYYEGHPCLWSLILSFFAKMDFPYITLNILSFLIMAGTALLILKKAPFNEFVKIVLVLSAPFIYNYSVISRNYCLIPLALCLIALNYKQRHERPIKYTLSILFLAWTHVVMLGMVGGLYFLFFYEEFIERRKTNTKAENKKAIISFIIAVVGLLSMVLPIGIGSSTCNLINTETRKELLYIIKYISLFLFDSANIYNILFLIFSLLLFFIYEFSYHKKELIIFLFTIIFQIYAYYFVYYLSEQRCDLYIFIFMFLMWIQDDKFKSNFQKYFTKFISISLVLLLILYSSRYEGLITRDYYTDYSQSRTNGEFINENIENDSIMLAENMFVTTGAIPYVGKWKNIKFYGLERDDYYTFVSWDYEVKKFDDKYLLNKIEKDFSNVKDLYVICEGLECYNHTKLIEDNYLVHVYSSDGEGFDILSIYKVNRKK